MGTLTGKTAVVTGSTSGIGLAYARAFAGAGANIVLNGMGVPADIEKERSGIETDFKVKAVHSPADMTKPAEIADMIALGEKTFGSVDILVNNAGIAIVRGVDDLTEEDFDRTITVNLKSAFLCTQAVLPMMRTRKWGRIVNISSGAARGAGSIGPHYNASKAAMEGMTRGYAARLVKEGITVNAVAPSLIETDMMRGQSELVSRIPMGRFGTAEEVAQAVMLLVNNPYMTGQTIAMSGGMAFN